MVDAQRDCGHSQLDRIHHPRVASVIACNVDAISQNRRMADQRRTYQQRAADLITRFAGTMTFVYLHVVWFALWLGVNMLLVPFDPVYSVLTMTVSLEAHLLVGLYLSKSESPGIVDGTTRRT